MQTGFGKVVIVDLTGKVTIVFQLILEEEQTGILERRTDRN